LVLVAVVAACGKEPVSPVSGPAANLNAVSDLSRTAQVGTTIPGGIIVRVSDASGRPVAGVAVAFTTTVGNGSTTPSLAVTDSKGQASAAWSVGTIAGQNEVTATVSSIQAPIKFEATGTPGSVNAIAITPRNARMLSTVDTVRVSAQSLDSFGNLTTPAPTFVARDPSLVSIDATGLVRALRRGSGTYLVATAGAKSDSILVTVLAVGQSICTGAATPVDLAIGQVLTQVAGSGFCVHASSSSNEYAIVPFYNAPVASASTQIEVLGQGLTTLGASAALFSRRAVTQQPTPKLVPDDAFESRLRARERTEGTARMAAAGAWRSSQRALVPGARATTVVPSIGDLVQLNVNANDFCDNADYRTGRVAAITNNAIVIADTANPAGGFTDDEYRSIGVTFDTLVNPVDTTAFGAPTDIDNNGHVIMFFTRAVNELTSSGASSVVLGFFYQRDLFPKTGAPGPCPGSNYAEMFYLMVPDTGGVVNGNRRLKPQVVSFTNGTVAHEYQHLINASRRMYVNGVGTNFEEKWLDEGLAHSAEELNFWRASGLSPRQNLDASIYADPLSKTAAAYSTFELNNFRRYATYLTRTESQGPIGVSPLDDDLYTRGAIWNFLRYAVDHVVAAGGDETAFWHALVNSKTTGIANLTNVLGSAPNAMLRDWAISVFLDDDAPNVDPLFLQPSWNLRSALTGGGTSTPFPLVTRTLTDGVFSTFVLAGFGVSFERFSVPGGQDALLTVTSGGQPLPPTILLAVVRVR
jgi:hypothetical protein